MGFRFIPDDPSPHAMLCETCLETKRPTRCDRFFFLTAEPRLAVVGEPTAAARPPRAVCADDRAAGIAVARGFAPNRPDLARTLAGRRYTDPQRPTTTEYTHAHIREAVQQEGFRAHSRPALPPLEKFNSLSYDRMRSGLRPRDVWGGPAWEPEARPAATASPGMRLCASQLARPRDPRLDKPLRVPGPPPTPAPRAARSASQLDYLFSGAYAD